MRTHSTAACMLRVHGRVYLHVHLRGCQQMACFAYHAPRSGHLTARRHSTTSSPPPQPSSLLSALPSSHQPMRVAGLRHFLGGCVAEGRVAAASNHHNLVFLLSSSCSSSFSLCSPSACSSSSSLSTSAMCLLPSSNAGRRSPGTAWVDALLKAFSLLFRVPLAPEKRWVARFDLTRPEPIPSGPDAT